MAAKGILGNLRDEDIGDAGSWVIFKRSIKLIWSHSRLFLLIAALIAFPLLVVEQALSQIFTSVELNSVILPAIQKWAASNYTNFEVDPGAMAWTGAAVVGGNLIDQLLFIIPTICIVYSVAGVLSKTPVTIAEAVGAVPKLWKPVLLTDLYLFAVGTGGLLIMGLVWFVANLLSSMALVLVAVFVSAVIWFLLFRLQLAVVVAVLEGVYGVKGLGKAWRLLQGRKLVAFKTMLLCGMTILCFAFVFGFVTNGVLAILGISTDPLEQAASGAVLGPAIQVVSNAAFASVFIVLVLVAETFLYFSCKARHGESVAESGFIQSEVLQGGYEQVGKHSENYEV